MSTSAELALRTNLNSSSSQSGQLLQTVGYSDNGSQFGGSGTTETAQWRLVDDDGDDNVSESAELSRIHKLLCNYFDLEYWRASLEERLYFLQAEVRNYRRLRNLAGSCLEAARRHQRLYATPFLLDPLIE